MNAIIVLYSTQSPYDSYGYHDVAIAIGDVGSDLEIDIIKNRRWLQPAFGNLPATCFLEEMDPDIVRVTVYILRQAAQQGHTADQSTEVTQGDGIWSRGDCILRAGFSAPRRRNRRRTWRRTGFDMADADTNRARIRVIAAQKTVEQPGPPGRRCRPFQLSSIALVADFSAMCCRQKFACPISHSGRFHV